MNGQGRSDCPLGSVLQGYGGSEKGQDPITPQFIHRAFVLVDLVDEQLEDLIHERKGLLWAELFGERREPLHVHEHDGDVSPLSLYSVPLREDLFSQAAGEILLNLGKLFVKGEVFWQDECAAVRSDCGRTLRRICNLGWIGGVAVGADHFQLGAAFPAEFHSCGFSNWHFRHFMASPARLLREEDWLEILKL